LPLKIAVLLGGTSAERDVSLVTGLEISKALSEKGHQVTAIDCAYGAKVLTDWSADSKEIIRVEPSEMESRQTTLNRNIFETIRYILDNTFDVVVLALHGGYGENGQLQALLKLANIPFTGSEMLASAMGMDKHVSKSLFRQSGVPTAPWVLLRHPEKYRQEQVKQFGLPLVVKPNDQGSTVGLSIVDELQKMPEAISLAFQHSDSVLIEKFIPGREMTVAILNGEALPVIEIIPEHGIYDYECKYQTGKSQYVVPAEISEQTSRELQNLAQRAYHSINCRHYSRIDFRVTDENEAFCLEVNTLPGMTPTSLVPKAANAVGINFSDLIERIVLLALNSK